MSEWKTLQDIYNKPCRICKKREQMKGWSICRSCYMKNLKKTLKDFSHGKWKTGAIIK